MKNPLSLHFLILLLSLSLSGFAGNVSAAEQPAGVPATREKVVLQVSDSVPAKWSLTLNNARNALEALGKGNIDIEIVAYGPGIEMLRAGSEAGARIAQAQSDGIKVVACQNTMRGMKLAESDMLPSIGYVPSGVVELIEKQKEGWSYIHP